MIWHDYLTSISCEVCSEEYSVERNLGEKKMRSLAKKKGWKVIDGRDICPCCAVKEEKNNYD